jgi:hypothetical protein
MSTMDRFLSLTRSRMSDMTPPLNMIRSSACSDELLIRVSGQFIGVMTSGLGVKRWVTQ